MIFVALLLVGIIMFSSGLRLHILLKIKLKHLRFRTSLMYGILAKYYGLVTPWALGSQPILIGIMYQRKVPIGFTRSSYLCLDWVFLHVHHSRDFSNCFPPHLA